ncbi:TIM-barrel domain-containing protein [Alteromonas mediterranea]|uniref:Glycosyl hydrolase n=1 Tax=Alteromonas mediterranea TaxID=314275 RepID=A0AAC8XMG4_9ALTE|nr:TIM-barrel domain-containing protein [Alteromonas mediterranea]AFV87377.1 glycosyl hydrolase family protein [Alteromonas mediterranea DE1]AGP99393.1 glycosyl hydrolase family protein [Alteromonas mediterranea UM7]AGQ03552.1 glycosyl hydrolase family protein [Alteromonas mediterranea UM4b]AMJ80263.1 glycosyl hydrolase [Alteromonas mediterranea]AMJ84418.1 glycosyl hydrolase [Alteromonas mediterranea]|tara:strand:+ start:2218 stop:4683 length:2466 start_codon:yes stop_codon:yes gene_type:complete
MSKKHKRSVLSAVVSATLSRRLLATLPALALISGNALAVVEQLSLQGNTLYIDTDTNDFTLTALGNKSFQVTYVTDNSGKPYENLPSMALPEHVAANELTVDVSDTPNTITLTYDNASASIDKQSHAISYSLNGEVVTKERDGLSINSHGVSLSFALSDDEKLYGGGQRVLGMDRRGNAMPLYNKAHYGYTTSSNQMYFGLSAVMSSKHYSVLFDNTASGELDMGSSTPDELLFSAKGGRASYIMVLGESLSDTVKSTVAITGKQPLPPRWLLGNFASRFGYKSQDEVMNVVDAFNKQDIPVDAVVLDLYWFGKDIKGHMGNLSWDTATFPEPEKMISELREQAVKTVLITEPFILTTSKQWDSAVENNALAQNDQGTPYTFDFYFGNTGLVDVFSEAGQDWFWQYYEKLAAQGVAGWWGDLGEPEVHPDDIQHAWSEAGLGNQTVSGTEVHNGYGHQWAKTVYNNLTELQSDTRPFVLMRSGFLGSQRYGMVPWTGDVSRSWGGLKPQVELALQMSVFGLAYTHSDLGGFAGGDTFDAELYTRWLQFGTFSPVFRPHAQDNIAPEPVFHDDPVKSIAREFIQLRYDMLPYNYSLAFENALFGTPLMRPLAMVFNENKWFESAKSYMWGDALLVSPVTQPNQQTWAVELPPGIWFDFFSSAKYQGGKTVDYPLTQDNFPVWVKAGSFMPMSEGLSRTEHFDARELEMHYWHDHSVISSSYTYYEDDGKSPNSVEKGLYTTLQLNASVDESADLTLTLDSQGSYIGMPQQRNITYVVHGLTERPQKVLVDGAPAPATWSEKGKTLSLAFTCDYQQSVEIVIM